MSGRICFRRKVPETPAACVQHGDARGPLTGHRFSLSGIWVSGEPPGPAGVDGCDAILARALSVAPP